jgi:hypothetical protein
MLKTPLGLQWGFTGASIMGDNPGQPGTIISVVAEKTSENISIWNNVKPRDTAGDLGTR